MCWGDPVVLQGFRKCWMNGQNITGCMLAMCQQVLDTLPNVAIMKTISCIWYYSIGTAEKSNR
jgi:hypothetical protein